MKRAITRLLCLPILAIAPVAAAQQTVLGSPHTPGSVPVKNPQNDAYGQNYSSEPYVIEQYTTTLRFNDDGTAERVVTARIHAQTETGVSRLSDLGFRLRFSAYEQFNLVSLRIRRPSGASTTPTPSVMNLSTSAVHDAPAYYRFSRKRA